MLDHPFDSRFEGTLFPSFDLVISDITTDSETMRATLKVFALVSRSKFTTTKNLVGFGLGFMRELSIGSATVD